MHNCHNYYHFYRSGHLDIISNLVFKLDETKEKYNQFIIRHKQHNSSLPNLSEKNKQTDDHQIPSKSDIIPKIVWQTWKNWCSNR